MALTCTVCASPDLAAIDSLLMGPTSHRQIAVKYGLTRHAVDRHAGNGHVAGNAVAVPLNGGDLDTLIAHLEAQQQAYPNRTDISRELRIAYAERAKRAGPVVVDDGRPTWQELRDREAFMFAALEPFPDARRALAKALRDELKQRRDERAITTEAT